MAGCVVVCGTSGSTVVCMVAQKFWLWCGSVVVLGQVVVCGSVWHLWVACGVYDSMVALVVVCNVVVMW